MPVIQILKEPFEICFSGNPIYYSFAFAPYTFVEAKQDFKMRFTLQKETGSNTGVFVDVRSDIFYPDIRGSISADIQSITEAYLEFHTPRITQQVPLIVHGQSARFRITALIQKDGVQFGPTIISNIITVIKGGLAYDKYQYSSFFTSYIAMQKKPLHFFSDDERVRIGDNKFLTWLYYPNNNLNQFINIIFYTGNLTLPVLHSIPVPAVTSQWHIYTALISPKYLIAITGNPALAASLANFEIEYYTVEVVDSANTVVIAPIKFNIDYRSFFSGNLRQAGRYLAYSNSIGGFETLNILGEVEMQAEYSSSNAQITVPPSGIRNALLVPQVLSSEVFETEKYIGSTDFITLEKLQLLRDLLLSRNVKELRIGTFVPALINKKTVKFYSNKDSLYSMAIEWQMAYSNTFYTPINLQYAITTCPALDKFIVIQTTKNKLQILWSMPTPYDLAEIEIDDGSNVFIYTLNGNSGSQEITFVNPAVAPANGTIIVKGRVICEPDAIPMGYGPQTIINLNVFANSVPVANADTFAIAAGYTTPQVLPGSVLDNDYDPDGDAIEAIAIPSGSTTAGGTYSLSAAGVVTYTPPSSLFNGIDTFDYAIQELGNPASAAIATVNINVGNVGLGNGFYVKLIIRDHLEIGAGYNLQVIERILIGFFADPACSIPKNATGLGVTVNVNNRNRRTNVNSGNVITDTSTALAIPATGTEVEIFYGPTTITFGLLINPIRDTRTFTLLPGAGYIPV